MPPPFTTNMWFNDKTRPAEFGKVTIVLQEVPRSKGPLVIRPTTVSGLVVVDSTTGRPGAPEPGSGLRVGQEAKVAKAYRYDPKTGINAYNTGIVDAEKGHVMALELGGPDHKWNIVPQWAKWQGSGEWRRMEEGIRERAKAGLALKTSPYYIMFHAMVGYKKNIVNADAGLRRVAFPSHFTVNITHIDVATMKPVGSPIKMYDDSPSRNETDDMLHQRTFMNVDKRLGGAEWDPGYDDWQEKEKTNKGKKRDASGFGSTGQNARYTPIPNIQYSGLLFDVDAYGARFGHQLEVNKRARLNLPDETVAEDPFYEYASEDDEMED